MEAVIDRITSRICYIRSYQSVPGECFHTSYMLLFIRRNQLLNSFVTIKRQQTQLYRERTVICDHVLIALTIARLFIEK